MIMILLSILCLSPFYGANFTSLSKRSISVFSNPAGTGLQTGAEGFFTYHPDVIKTGVSLGNTGFGMTKMDSIIYYETCTGLKLPGAFSLGYAYQFDIGDDYNISNHICGLICQTNQYVSLGYKTTLGAQNYMFGGISIKPYKDYLTLSFDVEYEGINSVLNYHCGGMIHSPTGLGINFRVSFIEEDINWFAGLEIAFGYVKLAGAYSGVDKKISGGIILSAQKHETIMPTDNNTQPAYF